MKTASPARSSGLAVEETEDSEVRHALPRAGLPDDPERLAAADGEREPVDGVDDAVRRRELDAQVLDLEEDVSPSAIGSLVPDPRVEVGVHDVDDEVHDHDGDRAHEDDGRRRPAGRESNVD